MKTNSELLTKLNRARWFLLNHTNPEVIFYANLAMGLADVIGNPHGKTACVDGKRIYWDETFLDNLTDEETRFVLLHETLHCAHGHLWRFPAGACDHKTANAACDHAINLILKRIKNILMPQGGLADVQFDGMAEEIIYAALAQKPAGQDDQPGQNDQAGASAGPGQESAANSSPSAKPGTSGAGPDDPCGAYCAPADEANQAGTGQDGKPAESLRDKWERAIIQAAQAAKASGCGSTPADMQRELNKMAAVKIDWKAETADFVKNSIAQKNDWTRGSRRMLWQSVVYPSRRRDACGLVVGVRDTSGSISDETAAQFSAILGAACAELGAELLLIDCDCAIQNEIRILPGEELPSPPAGGGTDFKAPFERAAKLIEDGENVSGLIYLTDLDGPNWPAVCAFPTLCICTLDTQAPSGRTVKILN